MNRPNYKTFFLSSETGKLLERISDQWLLSIRETNPAILYMFRDRDVKPYRDLLPWSGEFAGKYITGAYYVYLATGRRDLYDYVQRFISDLLKYQDADGYLGCFSRQCRLTGAYSQNPDVTGLTWDCWAHYHIMFGLLLWYDATGKSDYLKAVEKIATMFMRKFYNGKKRIVDTGSSEMNLSVFHGFCLLYSVTKKREYLSFAKEIEKDLADPGAGDYINYTLNGYEYYQCPKPRWESLHVIMGIAEMYRCTKNSIYLDVASKIFYSCLKTDVHNTGAFSTDEQAIGNPFKNGNIETCCVIAFNALAIEIYRLNRDPAIIDFLERSHYNAVMGYCSPSGRWSTYNTPMEGTKCANYHSIVFQSRPGSPDLNCCSANAPRGVGQIIDWLITEEDNVIFINGYENVDCETENGLKLKISGDYPASSRVTVSVNTLQARKIRFRIPSWSKKTTVRIGSETFFPVSGQYFSLERRWNCDVTIEFDFTPYLEKGGRDGSCYAENSGIPNLGQNTGASYEEKYSVYCGPVLYGLQNGENTEIDFAAPPAIDCDKLMGSLPKREGSGAIHLKVDGVTLTDFYHLGVDGSEYKTWFEINGRTD